MKYGMHLTKYDLEMMSVLAVAISYSSVLFSPFCHAAPSTKDHVGKLYWFPNAQHR